MALPAIMLGAGLGMSAAKMAFGAGQLLTNKKPERPVYEIPGEAGEIVDLARRRAGSPMPGSDVIEGNIGASTSRAISEARKVGPYDVTRLHENELDALRGLGVQEAQFKLGAEDRLMKALEFMKGVKDDAFAWNEAGKYQDDMMDFLAKRQSGMANLFGGANDAMNAGFNYLQFKQTEGIWDALEPDFMTMAEKAAYNKEQRRMKKRGGFTGEYIYGENMI